jgi:hypothetical protein
VSHGYPEVWKRDPSDARRWYVQASGRETIDPRLLFELEKTPEWASAIAAIKADHVLGNVADRMVGDETMAVRVQSFGLLSAAVEAWAREPRRLRRLHRLITGWRALYRSEFVEQISLAILDGVAVSRSIRLSDGVLIRSMTEAEVSDALSIGAITTVPRIAGMAFLDTPSCLMLTRRVRLRVADEFRPVRGSAKTLEHAQRQEEAAMAALRLNGFVRARLGARISKRSWGGGVSWSSMSLSDGHASGQPLDASSARRIRRDFARAELRLRRADGITIALRRFSQSVERQLEQDRYLDLWIAMEALFGSEAPTEVTFRLALNTANAISIPNASRRQVFEWVQQAYRVRSRLVHGGNPSAGRITRLDGQPAHSLSDLSEDLEQILRTDLKTRLRTGQPLDLTSLALRP